MPVYRCRECGESFDNFGAMGTHRKAAHPRTAPRMARRVTIEGASGADPSPEPDAPTLDTPEPGPSVAPTVLRITPEQRTHSTREAVAEAFTAEVLADMLVSLSRAVSELDGAGEAGVLSKVQAAQVAVLLHDAAVDLIIDRFRGDVTRFKASLAVVLILLAKGTVHARAIRDRIAERRALPMPVDAAPPEGDDAAVQAGATPAPLTNLGRMTNEDIFRYNATG
jgi:hypothetical protein